MTMKNYFMIISLFRTSLMMMMMMIIIISMIIIMIIININIIVIIIIIVNININIVVIEVSSEELEFETTMAYGPKNGRSCLDKADGNIDVDEDEAEDEEDGTWTMNSNMMMTFSHHHHAMVSVASNLPTKVQQAKTSANRAVPQQVISRTTAWLLKRCWRRTRHLSKV